MRTIHTFLNTQQQFAVNLTSGFCCCAHNR